MGAKRFPDDVFRADLTPIVGKKFGHLSVLAMAGRRTYHVNGKPTRIAYVLVRCDCGREYEADARHVRRSVNRCRECGYRMSAELARSRSTRLPSGRTLVEVAAKSGVSLNTVTQRWLRGWPEKDLGLPVQTRRALIRYREEVR